MKPSAVTFSVLVALAGCAPNVPEATGGGAGGGGGGGTSAQGPTLQVLPSTSIAFGAIGFVPGAIRSASRMLVLRNVGSDSSARLRLVSPALEVTALNPNTAGEEFSATLAASYDNTRGLQAGKELLEIELRWTPSSLGRKEVELKIRSNDAAHPSTSVLITAEAVEVPPCRYAVTPATRLDFGVVSGAAQLPLTITNLDFGVQSVCELFDISLGADSSTAFTLVGGPIAERALGPGESLTLLIRADAPWFPTPAVVTGSLQFSVDARTAARRSVELHAETLSVCVTVSPSDLDFGTVMSTCTSRTRTFTIYNTCPIPVTLVSESMVMPAGELAGGPNCPFSAPCPEFIATSTPAPNTVLMPGAIPATFGVRYHPINLGTDYGTLLLKVDQAGRMLDYPVTFTGNGDTGGVNTDTFKQEAEPKADLLFVISNRSSMASKQQSLAANLGRFVDYALASRVDFQFAVTTTEMAIEGGRILGDASNPKLLTRLTPDVKNKFLKKVASVGAGGSQTAQALAAATAAVTPRLSNTDNAGLVRSDATLAVLIVSDSDDESPGLVSEYLTQLLGAKSAPSQISLSAVAPILASAPAGCSYDGAGGAPRIAAAVSALNGVKEDICDPAWGQAFEPIGTVEDWGHRAVFYLTATPARANALIVKQDGALVARVNPDGAPVWHYDPVGNSVNFEPLFIPPPGSTLTVSYTVGCVP